ncbi:MAG TPA: hypothetical protein VHS34_17050 [Terriglobales bacterium]|jgi:hypothetical protein|nr:hypothetical protein [Terriglobales bacterium]
MQPSRFAGVVLAIFFALTALTAQQKTPLTNADVVKMVKSGMAETAIVAAITGSDTQFDLSSTGLQGLSQAGVSSKVIRAMLAAEAKKKSAAEAAENSAAAQAAPAAQEPGPDAASGMASQGMSPQGMSPDQMQQMMNNMPPEMRERMQASMAQRNARRSAKGGGSAGSIPGHAGVPVPLDSALYASFMRLKTQPGYHMVMTMQTNDPRMAAMAQSIFSPQEMLVVGNTRQYTMHYKMQATDVPGTVDDWEIRAVVQNGRAARLITSAAVPRLLKESEEKAAHDLAELDRMAATTIARAAAEGPMGALGAGMTAAGVAMTHVEVPKMLKKERDMFSWQCRDVPQLAAGAQSTTQLTDIHSIGDQNVNGAMADGYEFYSYDNAKTQGTVHLFVAKDTGLPLRIELVDPNGAGGVQMNYGPLVGQPNIEIPACMNAK